eukprot:3373061-Alexandrium_andersonii.AAC.1
MVFVGLPQCAQQIVKGLHGWSSGVSLVGVCGHCPVCVACRRLATGCQRILAIAALADACPLSEGGQAAL